MSTLKQPVMFPTVAKRNVVMNYVDPSMLKLEHNTPLPTARRVFGKYDEIFASMKYGSCIACEYSEFQKIANALRKYLERTKRPGKVVHVSKCEDGKARVWLVSPEK